MSSSRKNEETEEDDTIDTNSEASSISSLAAEPNRGLRNRRRSSDYSDTHSEPADALNGLRFSNSDINLAHDFATSHIARFSDERRQFQEVVPRNQQPSNLPRLSAPVGMQNELRNVTHGGTTRLRRTRNIRTSTRRSLSPRNIIRARRSAPNQCSAREPTNQSIFRKTRSGAVYGISPP
ncbi:hypothetical protein CBL_04868 [Carabus blaptoides fortunei]